MKLAVYVLCIATCALFPRISSLSDDFDFDAEKEDVNAYELLQQQRERGAQPENIQQRNARPAGCPADFVYLRSVNGCYKVVTDPLEWGLAGIRCRKSNSNAHLLIINSGTEQRAVVEDLVKWYGGCTAMWTAGQRLNPATPDGFMWKIVNPVDYPSARIEEITYTHWAPGQPDYYQGVESCMHLRRDFQYGWNDSACWGRFCSVCEIDM